MKFIVKKRVYVYLDHNSAYSFQIFCDQIIYKETKYLNKFVFVSSGVEVGNCPFGLVDHFEFYESSFSTETNIIDPYDVIGGDLVES